MGFLMTFVGLLLAIVLFIYIINAFDEGRRKLNQLTDPVEVASAQRSISQNDSYSNNIPGAKVTVKANQAVKNLSDEMKELIPKRKCPICWSELKRDEPLYAGNIEREGRRTILIYGCQHCYREKSKNNKDGDQT